ncbi:hypothetical protein [Devosia sp. 1635]|uniref:hypothetical protein n=1 Tax=Devosia sp. 1635 TaxID=2726066 RepID=UPI001566ED27|nr:hypothetical protein [Devosia sp. 1635]
MNSRMTARLDLTSKRTIGRFVLKMVTSFLVANFLAGERGYLEGVAAWLAFYALFAMVGSLLIKEAIAARSFNYWDEAAWLMLAACIVHIISRQPMV